MGAIWDKCGADISDAGHMAAATAANLAWRVSADPIYVRYGEGYAEVPGWYAITRGDVAPPASVMTVTKERYRTIQNPDAFAAADSLVARGLAKYARAGYLQGGRVVWLLLRLLVPCQANYEWYAIFRNRHDGRGNASLSVYPYYRPMECVLHGMQDGVLRSRAGHRGDQAVGRAAHAAGICGLVEGVVADAAAALAKLDSVPLDPAQVAYFFEEAAPNVAPKRDTRARHVRAEMQEVFDEALDNLNIDRTPLGAYTAVCRWVDHRWCPNSAPDKRMDGALFRLGWAYRERAWRAAHRLLGV